MSISNELDRIISESNKLIKSSNRLKCIKIYTEGIRAKLKQVEFTLEQLESLQNEFDLTSTINRTDGTRIIDFDSSMRVSFYCDSYWTYLFSSLDVLAQVINQVLKLSVDEKDVSFNKLNQILKKSKVKNAELDKIYLKCKKSQPFKNLLKYRNCSIHRRQIYIQEETVNTKHTAGYESATDAYPTIKRLLCDDPLVLNPRIVQQRKIPDYLVKTKTKITKLH